MNKEKLVGLVATTLLAYLTWLGMGVMEAKNNDIELKSSYARIFEKIDELKSGLADNTASIRALDRRMQRR